MELPAHPSNDGDEEQTKQEILTKTEQLMALAKRLNEMGPDIPIPPLTYALTRMKPGTQATICGLLIIR